MKKEDFNKLTQDWYQKLKDEGFIDIEDTSHPKRPLISWHSFKWRNESQERIKSLEEYYSKARALTHTYMFETETHRAIWELHAEGHSKRSIERALEASSTLTAYKREWIGVVIQTIAETIK